MIQMVMPCFSLPRVTLLLCVLWIGVFKIRFYLERGSLSLKSTNFCDFCQPLIVGGLCWLDFSLMVVKLFSSNSLQHPQSQWWCFCTGFRYAPWCTARTWGHSQLMLDFNNEYFNSLFWLKTPGATEHIAHTSSYLKSFLSGEKHEEEKKRKRLDTDIFIFLDQSRIT